MPVKHWLPQEVPTHFLLASQASTRVQTPVGLKSIPPAPDTSANYLMVRDWGAVPPYATIFTQNPHLKEHGGHLSTATLLHRLSAS